MKKTFSLIVLITFFTVNNLAAQWNTDSVLNSVVHLEPGGDDGPATPPTPRCPICP